TYTANSPVYMSYEDFRAAVQGGVPQALESHGKIYLKGNLIFVNKPFEGIHVIDNSNPSAPQNIAFITIPGNVDMAVRDNYLYADSYIDLVVLDISSPVSTKEVKRIQSVFPYSVPAYDENYELAPIDVTQGVVVGWKIEEVTVETECDYNSSHGRGFFAKDEANAATELYGDMSGSQETGNGRDGRGGSMARFTVIGDYLYTVDVADLHVFNITTTASPSESNVISVGEDIETIYPFEGKLFIGSMNGMYIYSISDPSSPVYVSEFQHVRSCDPVVAAGGYAYVTLRTGTRCGGWQNELDVLDITSVTSPILIKAYEMTGPYGLGIDGTTLFICDGTAGLKVYDVTDKQNIDQRLLGNYTGMDTYDVIPVSGRLLLVADDGLYQYDYSDPSNLVLLSYLAMN
ncbi:MAG: hypothetical protein KJ607_05135, partial [Bacteroidetes bacterium]|nr:hypothetical protein [Bacteroidota bacterium]